MGPTGDRPAWAQRMQAERAARSWSVLDAVRAMRAHSKRQLPSEKDLARQWRRWEAGDAFPRDYQELIAATFGTTTFAFFPVTSRRDGPAEVLAASGMTTADLLGRLRASDIDHATLDALRITVDRLCCEYVSLPGDQLLVDGRTWLSRLAGMGYRRVTLTQHRELLALAGWLALLVGCVEYDTGQRRNAEATRRAALALGEEAGHAQVIGWAHELRAWFALTSGDYRGVIVAADAGIQAAPRHDVAVQLHAQKAKAWARVGDQRQTEVALDAGRQLLEDLPYPDDIDNHFVVDPAKYDFYAMDCYRNLQQDRFAEHLARQVLATATSFDGAERSPMRLAEARITLSVVAARSGDLDQALTYGRQALHGQRKSLPSLRMVARDLHEALTARTPVPKAARELLTQLRTLGAS